MISKAPLLHQDEGDGSKSIAIDDPDIAEEGGDVLVEGIDINDGSIVS